MTHDHHSEQALTGSERAQLEAFLHDNRRELTETDTIESVLAELRSTWAEADEIAAAHDLDSHAQHNRRGPLTLRWIYLHMVEELARHAGHGDILREQILAEATSR